MTVRQGCRKLLGKLERETGFEPATLALARRCSTTELFPPRSQEKRNYTGITREASRRGDGERSPTGQPAGWARLPSSHRLAGRPPDPRELSTQSRGRARPPPTLRTRFSPRCPPCPRCG